jgi:2,5-furandicarboxylate decarboxylase 1
MALSDLRETIDALRGEGLLVDIDATVSPVFEVAACLAAASVAAPAASGKEARAVCFSSIKGHKTRIVGNLISSREVFALALGVSREEVSAELVRRLGTTIEPVEVEHGAVEEVDASQSSLQEVLPILTHYVEDSAPFITTGLIQSIDPDTSKTVRGVHRMEVRGDKELGVAFLNPPLSTVYLKYKERGLGMPLAVTIGMEPLTFASFALKGVSGADKLAVAGGLRGEPVKVVRAALTGICVPALCEYLLEGEVDATDLRTDGPLGEISGYSQSFADTPTFRVRRITHRTEPIYHALLPNGPEGDLLLRTVAEALISSQLKGRFPFAEQLHFIPTTFGSSVVVRVSKVDRELVRTLLVQLLTMGMVKKAVAVADDVDPADPAEVEWSLATRFRPAKDSIILSDLRGVPIDPSCDDTFRSGKIALDATGYSHMSNECRATLSPEAVNKADALF